VGALHQLATPWLWAYHHHHHHHEHHHNRHHNISTCGGFSLLIENHYFCLDGKTYYFRSFLSFIKRVTSSEFPLGFEQGVE